MLLASSTALGVGLRIYQLSTQVIVDDEWHSLHKLLEPGYLSILTDFGVNDHCIPLTLLYRALADTVGLSEILMHLPSLLAGVLTLLLAPRLTETHLPTSVTMLLAWLLAISPLHIYFSRLARPYSILVLLGAAGPPLFFHWWQTGSRRSRIAFTVCATAALYVNLSSAPLFAAIALYATASRLFGLSIHRQPLRCTLSLFVTIAFVASTLLLAPLLHSNALATKLVHSTITLETLWGGASLLLGTSDALLLIGLIALVCIGALSRRDSAAAYIRFLVFCCTVQLIALIVLRPTAVIFPIVFARYCAVSLPALLTLLATGIVALDAQLRERFHYWPRYVLGAAVIASALTLGPLSHIYYYPNNFTNAAALQADYSPDRYFDRFRPVTIPEFYYTLAHARPGSLTIVEAPWHYYWYSYAYYQRIHRQHVIIGGIDRRVSAVRIGEIPLDGRLVDFRQLVNVGDYAMLARRGVDYVIFHKVLDYETLMPFLDRDTARDVGNWEAEYALNYGPAVYEDSYIAVFDVRRSTLPAVMPFELQ